VYYGDEIGLRGTDDYDGYHHDPDARWAFPWDDENEWDTDLLAYFKEVIGLRQAHPALRRGRFIQLDAEDYCFAFARQDNQETLVVVVNAAEEPAVLSLPLNGRPLTPELNLQPRFGVGTLGPVLDERLPVTVPGRSGIVLAGNPLD
jgi:glycosidase